ncbi:MAG: DUF1848 domain-containing protein [Lachnospiraceae bacterium]|nr:DUF1848 domain-containing protein [Lachnospiraceae bacterium]
MIINTGNRTDIPAYYSEWFYRRVEEGFVLTRNPYYPQQVTRYALSPDVVDCISFCTKNPQPMLRRLDELDGFQQFWMVTITPYGRDIEPFVPEKERVMDSFCALSERTGIRGMSWRYDPIFISEKYSLDYHIRTFEDMASRLQRYTDNCIISFIDLYTKTKRNFPGVREVTGNERDTIGREFTAIGRRYGIRIKTCCEGTDLARYGVDISGCMTKSVVERAVGCALDIPRLSPAREGCDCLLGNDIGMYNTCGHGCLYCYANYDRETVVRNMKLHDPKSPFLIGGAMEGDVVKEAKQTRYASGQLTLGDYFS